MPRETQFLSRLLGLYSLIVALAMATQREATLQTIAALLQDRPLLFVVGIFTLLAGLAMVLVHNAWSGGALRIVVTLIGWITLAKGASFLLLSPPAAADFYLGTMRYAQLYYGYMAFSLALGAWLAYCGFSAKARPA